MSRQPQDSVGDCKGRTRCEPGRDAPPPSAARATRVLQAAWHRTYCLLAHGILWRCQRPHHRQIGRKIQGFTRADQPRVALGTGNDRGTEEHERAAAASEPFRKRRN